VEGVLGSKDSDFIVQAGDDGIMMGS
jgi:hypothetical protein